MDSAPVSFADEDLVMYVIGLNGPPRCGKDSIGHALSAIIEDRHGVQACMVQLSLPMRETVYSLLGIPYSQTHYEAHKDDPQPIFNGDSIRRAMIDLSEEHCKRKYGNDFWCRSAMGRIETWRHPNFAVPELVIITDYGFPHEPLFFEDIVGQENHLLVRVNRPGKDFSNDSRGWVVAGQSREVYNEGTDLSQIATEGQRVYGHLMNQLGWQF